MKNLMLMRRASTGTRELQEVRAFVRTALRILATLPRRRGRGIR